MNDIEKQPGFTVYSGQYGGLEVDHDFESGSLTLESCDSELYLQLTRAQVTHLHALLGKALEL